MLCKYSYIICLHGPQGFAPIFDTIAIALKLDIPCDIAE